jgi:hypothetical protein
MFAITLRFAAGLAIGAAAALWLASRRSMGQHDAAHTDMDQREPGRTVPQRLSDYRSDGNGRIDESALIDGAVEDTFPASDPPAFMQALVAGRPPKEEEAAIAHRQPHKRAGEDAFAE